MSDINKKKLYFTFVLFIAIAFFSLINGCGKNNPLTPGISNTGNEEVFSDNGNNDPYPNLPGFDKSFNFRDSTPGYRDYSNNIDGFTGGTITADDTTGLHQVVFQPGVWGGVMYTPCGIGNYVTPFGNVICFRFDADCFGYGIGNWAKIIVDVSSYRTTSRSDKMGRLIGAYVYLKDGCTNSWDIVDSVELAENDNDVTISTTFMYQFVIMPKYQRSGDISTYNSSDSINGDTGGEFIIDQDQGSHNIDFQPGSFSGDEEISCELSVYTTVFGDMGVFEFEPDGLQFSQPVDFEVDLNALGGFPTNSVGLYYLNEDTDEWELVSVDNHISDNIANFQIEHFSRYSISGRRVK